VYKHVTGIASWLMSDGYDLMFEKYLATSAGVSSRLMDFFFPGGSYTTPITYCQVGHVLTVRITGFSWTPTGVGDLDGLYYVPDFNEPTPYHPVYYPSTLPSFICYTPVATYLLGDIENCRWYLGSYGQFKLINAGGAIGFPPLVAPAFYFFPSITFTFLIGENQLLKTP